MANILTKQQMYSVGQYSVSVSQLSDGSFLKAQMELAKREDMPVSGSWKFLWQDLWDRTDFNYQNVIKITCNSSVIGLLRYAVYCDENDTPYLLEVLHLEAIPKDERLVTPIGRWLIWYAVQVAFQYCIPNETDTLVSLDSVEDAIEYYGDIIKMEPQGWVSISPDEDGYAFRFTIAGARNFCDEQTQTYGTPKSV